MDVHHKIVLDKLKLPDFEGRRIISVSTATLEWAGTQLTNLAAAARAAPPKFKSQCTSTAIVS